MYAYVYTIQCMLMYTLYNVCLCIHYTMNDMHVWYGLYILQQLCYVMYGSSTWQVALVN